MTREPYKEALTRRDREVVDFTRSRVKNNTELTNFGKMQRKERAMTRDEAET